MQLLSHSTAAFLTFEEMQNVSHQQTKLWHHRGRLQQNELQSMTRDKTFTNHVPDKVLTVKIFKEPLL